MKVQCPTCQTQVVWDTTSEYRPFCSKRCQLIDLGGWANEENSIAAGSDKENEMASSLDIEDIEALLSQQEPDFFKAN
ncbi:DNA gyrase inhibitor YacG [Glaciecola sp. KUL10]|uniref:DNA gyrase inhibitor YacG n=1 Tax=Glaciecola sp. (strain KUL10) TaxID=2161813 RepID=UPI000D781C19|nr:DNA gyrase inhibitor YacG [Glaciecola sp. KUL10]